LILDFEIILTSAPAAAVAGVAPFFDVDERDFDSQILVRKDLGEMDQFVEGVEDLALLRAATSVDDFAVFLRALNEKLGRHERLDDKHLMLLAQRGDLLPNGGQRAVLDFDQHIADDGIDAEPSDADFSPRVVAGIERLQFAVQRSFHAVDPAARDVRLKLLNTEIAHNKQGGCFFGEKVTAGCACGDATIRTTRIYRLAGLMAARQLTQAELSRGSQVPRTTINEILAGGFAGKQRVAIRNSLLPTHRE